MKFAEFDQYSENLLMAQYDISEIISHELMKGEIREDFLITTIEWCCDPKPYLVKGTLSDLPQTHRLRQRQDRHLCQTREKTDWSEKKGTWLGNKYTQRYGNDINGTFSEQSSSQTQTLYL